MVVLSTIGLDAAADPRAVVSGPGYRISVLTSRLLRLEWDPRGRFVDLPTQTVVSRRFPVPEFTVEDTPDGLEIWTEHLHLSYDRRPFSAAGLTVAMRTRTQAAHHTRWRFGDELPVDPVSGNLGGTARTLDDVDGACPLEPGLLARNGFAVVDDSRSVQLTEDGWCAPRGGPSGRGGAGGTELTAAGAAVGAPVSEPQPEAGLAVEPQERAAEAGAQTYDLYFVGYGQDVRAALRDFFVLTGPSPLVPRWVLGNWWSRYHRYDADEYLGLMDRFAEHGLPFSVAVLDMDWHLVDIDPALGTGWTGYTWNRDLFPDPPGFLAALHERGLAVALNVHPADGVRRHEEAYPDVARDLGLDPSTGREIPFDITSRAFVDAYLQRLHHPHEAHGVDLWWLDWQSGGVTRMPGLDPLWMLNHIHHADSGRDGRRPLTFSRYAGLGSHRYPVGFSGDTIVTWASLDFQPYFTATAANVGYYWWSHDVGGHMAGTKDDELAARWSQLGAFSPVNRLHSSNSPFNSKEPWRFTPEAEQVMTQFLRLRHLLVPYLYSAAWTAHTDGVGIVRPMYHDHPGNRSAYGVPNQFMFGPDLLVAPVTTPADPVTGLASVAGWLPEGDWYDLFTGRRYAGGRRLTFHRALGEMPVLARAGAVVPLLPDPMGDVRGTPAELVLRVFPGAHGGAVVHEDDGAGAPTAADRQDTPVSVRWWDRGDGVADVVVAVGPSTGPGVRTRRGLTLDLVGAASVDRAVLRVDGHDVDGGARVGGAGAFRGPATPLRPGLAVHLGEVDLARGAEVHLWGLRHPRPDVATELFPLLDGARIAYLAKERAWAAAGALSGPALAAALHALDLPGNLYGALLEVVAARG